MFKRLLAWIRRTPNIPNIPDDARYVIYQNRQALAVPPATDVVIEPTCFSVIPIESRQEYLLRNPRRSTKDRAREWQIAQLPDECAFL